MVLCDWNTYNIFLTISSDHIFWKYLYLKLNTIHFFKEMQEHFVKKEKRERERKNYRIEQFLKKKKKSELNALEKKEIKKKIPDLNAW